MSCVFGNDQLGEMQKIIDAENSDILDVLAHYVKEDVEELEQEKLTKLLRLKYHVPFLMQWQTSVAT